MKTITTTLKREWVSKIVCYERLNAWSPYSLRFCAY